MFLGRFLVLSIYLLPGGPRPVRIQLILDLVRTRCPDSENQDPQKLRYQPLIEMCIVWQHFSVGLNSCVPTLCNGFPLPASHQPHHMSKKHQGHISITFSISFSIWLLSLSSKLKLHQVGPNVLFIYSLAGMHFHFWFEHITPCFTALSNRAIKC